MPKHYIELKAGLEDYNGIQTNWHLTRESAGNDFGAEENSEWPYFEEATGIPMSATVRTPFEFTFDQTSYTFRVGPGSAISPGKVLFSGKWQKPLTFSRGVVQFMHHSYNPNKCDVFALKCAPDTWHWSDFNISNAVQYTLLRPTDHQVVNDPGGVVTFAAPAPAGSYLKFTAIGVVQVSYDGGKTYTAAQHSLLDGYAFDQSRFNSYVTPVPVGVTSVQFKLSGDWYGPGYARDFSLISQSFNGAPPPPTPTPVPPTPTPVPPTPTPIPPTPTPSPVPSPTPINIQDAPCTVTLLGVTHTGTCSGTFTPGS
jgi:hypothetical protein